MKEGKPKFENKGLVAVLCVLLVIAVGLGIGIGVVNMNSGINSSVSEQVMEQEGDTDAENTDTAVMYFSPEENNVIYGTGPSEEER